MGCVPLERRLHGLQGEVLMAYQMNTQEFRQWMRLERAERVRKDRLEVAKQRKAAYRQAYWMRALRFETFKVGGLRFIIILCRHGWRSD